MTFSPKYYSSSFEVDETRDHSVHAGLVQPPQLLDDLLRRADQRVAAPAGDQPLLERLGVLERLALHAGDLDDVLRGAPVAVVDDPAGRRPSPPSRRRGRRPARRSSS
jgi:hypothetical protein